MVEGYFKRLKNLGINMLNNAIKMVKENICYARVIRPMEIMIFFLVRGDVCVSLDINDLSKSIQ